MKRTGARDVIVSLMVGVTVGYLIQTVLVSAGLRMLLPPLSYSVTLVVAAIAVFWLAWPIRAALHGSRKRPINALFASRVAMFAKASSLSGAVLTGFAGGLAYFALTRSVTPQAWALTLLLVAVGAGLLLLIAGLLAERFCTLPPDDAEGANG